MDPEVHAEEHHRVRLEARGAERALEKSDIMRTHREALVEWMLRRGFDEDQIRASSTPMLLPAYRLMGDDGAHVSAREVADAAKIELELLERLQRAIGLPRIEDPDAAVLSKADAIAAAQTKYFIDIGLEVEEAVAIIRVLAESLRRFASMIRDTSYKMFFSRGATEVEVAEAIEARVRKDIAPLIRVVDDLLLLEFRRMYELEGIDAMEDAAGELPGARQMAVAFADLAGFTRLGEALPPEHLARLANQLADVTYEIADTPVRFVKSIGDAVMLVSHDATALVDAVLQLVDSAARTALPPLRVGVAAGPVVSRAGDWFGSPVNVASRITALARPGSVLVTESARDYAGDDAHLKWSPMGAHELRGVPGPVKLFVAHRAIKIADG